MRLLFLLARQFNLIMQVKELSREGYDQPAIAKRTGLQPFVVRNYAGYAHRYSTEELRAAVEECVQTEAKVKTGYMNDVMSVELLLVKFSSSSAERYLYYRQSCIQRCLPQKQCSKKSFQIIQSCKRTLII